jgi:hypothetical protein
MKIERIYILSYKDDVRLTRCCVASIRRWYPDMPISLIKDEGRGAYDTTDLERHWDVEIFPTGKTNLGYGMGKLEPLFQARRERCVILDSDIVFPGRVLDRFDGMDEDFIVERSDYPADHIRAFYLDVEALRDLEPSFHFPGYVFNTGQYIATTGILTRQDFAPYIAFDEPAKVLRPDVFKAADQGVFNVVLLSKMVAGQLTLRREPMMHWPDSMRRRDIRPRRLTSNSSYPYMLHWVGPKYALFSAAPMGHMLKHFEAAYYARIPGGRRKRFARRVDNLIQTALGYRPWRGYPQWHATRTRRWR